MRRHAITLVLIAAVGVMPLAQSIRDRIRLSKDKQTPITEAQANELTLTLNDAAVRPIQIWVRTSATVDRTGRTLTGTVDGAQVRYIAAGQRVRAFPPESRSSMFQARVRQVTFSGSKAAVIVDLAGPGHAGSQRYILEIVTEPLEALSVPNEAIIESEGKRLVYVEAEKGRYVPKEIQAGVQGELYTQVLDGLKPGDKVVTFGSFFIDADYKLKGS